MIFIGWIKCKIFKLSARSQNQHFCAFNTLLKITMAGKKLIQLRCFCELITSKECDELVSMDSLLLRIKILNSRNHFGMKIEEKNSCHMKFIRIRASWKIGTSQEDGAIIGVRVSKSDAWSWRTFQKVSPVAAWLKHKALRNEHSQSHRALEVPSSQIEQMFFALSMKYLCRFAAKRGKHRAGITTTPNVCRCCRCCCAACYPECERDERRKFFCFLPKSEFDLLLSTDLTAKPLFVATSTER